MCGRFTNRLPWSEVHRLYRLTLDVERARNTQPRYNIAPTQDVLFVTVGANGDHKLREGRWWLVPWWAKEVPKAPMFNARSETVAEKSAFRDAFQSKRCLIPADGFYEWTLGGDGGKDPWFIHLYDKPFSFAGLWAHNKTIGITSCTILTADAQEPMTKLHDRQPVILDPAVYDAWLDPSTSTTEAKSLLTRNLDGELEFHRVDRQVNTYKFEGEAAAIMPINPL